MGKVASRLCFSMTGMTSFSTNSRAVWRTSFSSSFNCESKSMKSTPPNLTIRCSWSWLGFVQSLKADPAGLKARARSARDDRPSSRQTSVQCSNRPDLPATLLAEAAQLDAMPQEQRNFLFSLVPCKGISKGAQKIFPELEGGNAKEQDRKSTRLNSSHGYISYA